MLETDSGEPIESRNNPQGAFKGHTNSTTWDRLHAAYFGYALWTYLTQPFLYSYPGFETREMEPWTEDGETWQRLEVIFPGDIASHTRKQISYFDDTDCFGGTTMPRTSSSARLAFNTVNIFTSTAAY